MSQRPHRKGEFARVCGVSEQIRYKIPGTNVVRQIRRISVSLWVIAGIGYERPSVGVSLRIRDFAGGRVVREALVQERLDLWPQNVDELLMRQDGISVRRARRSQHQ